MSIHPIFALWCHPRCLSTAFERMMIERKDFKVIHEKFLYLYYVKQNHHLIIAQTQEIDKNIPIEFQDILNGILKEADRRPVFFKDMSVHVFNPKGYHATREFLDLFTNSFLIRDPETTILSHLKQNPKMIFEEVGYDAQYQVFLNVADMIGRAPPLIDAYDLENNPKGIIKAYCDAVKIPFIPDSLKWEPDVPEDLKNGEKTWHRQVVESTGFHKRLERFDPELKENPRFKEFYEASLPFYEAMYKYRIQAA